MVYESINGEEMSEGNTKKAADAVKNAASGVSQGFKDLVFSDGGEIDINWEPLLWKSDMSLTARMDTIKKEMEPWNVFASGKGLNFPPSLDRVKARYSENISKYFYNYLALAFADLAISGVLHQCDAVITLILVVLFYVAFEDDIPVLGKFYIGSRIKGAIVGIAFVWTFFTGGVFSFIVHSIFFGILAFIVHAFFRQTTEMDKETIAITGATEETPLAQDADEAA